ncbi:MAG: lipopolysaccharide biosynthesis protein [Hyphomicrobiales bacterium]
MYRTKARLPAPIQGVASDPKDYFAQPHVGRANSAAKSVVWASLNSIIPAIVTAIVFTVSSRFLTPAEFGLVALSSGIAAFAGSLSPAGFGQALIQRNTIGKPHADSVFWLCLLSAALLYAFLLLVAPLLASWFDEPELFLLIGVLGIRILFDLGAVVPNAILVRTMSFRQLAIRSVLGSVVGGSVCLILIAAGQTVWALVTAQLATSLVFCAASFFAIRWKPGLALSKAALSDLRRVGGFSSGHRFFNQLSLDQILIGAILGTAPLGLYAFAKRVFQLLNDAIAGAFGNVSHALFSSLQMENAKLREAFLLSSFASASMSFPIFCGLALVADTAVPVLFGDQWIAAVPVLQLFCFIGVLSCIGMVQGSLINSQGQAGWWFGYIGIKQFASVVVIIATFQFGLKALMLGLSAVTALFWPFAVARVMTILGMKWRAYLGSFAAPFWASLAMFPAVVLLPNETADLMSLLRQIAFGAVTYAVVMFVLSHKKIHSIYELIVKRRREIR